ncbi:MAG: hypothetical protein KAR20_15915 [Candidatus Heimdallarchaeota archaeon]|nr:hypothetical protein [Candidatus Heimdallarchaeota archaeon]
MSADQAMKIARVNVAEHLGLDSETPLETGSIYWTAQEFLNNEGDFERNEHVLRHHFTHRLIIITSRLSLQKENFQLSIKKEALGANLSWMEINQLFSDLIDLFKDNEQITKMLGFPAERYEEMRDCIEAMSKWKGEKDEKVTKL